jgi:hypothetical protein
MVTRFDAGASDVTGPAVNLVPSQYRNVSVADVPVTLDEKSLRAHLLGRPVYRRTRYLVARHGEASAVVEVSKESEQPLFSAVTAVSVIARPDETRSSTRPTRIPPCPPSWPG